MSEEKALTVSKPQINMQTWEVIRAIAPVAQAARMFGVTEEQAAIVMLKGHELGLGLATAFEFIPVIDGKPSISPKGALAKIHQSNELAGLRIEDAVDSKGQPSHCTVWMKRTNGFEYQVTFSMEDAKRAELVKPRGGWDKYPANMLRWRAIGYCADVVFPDVIGGMYRPEELGADVDENGEPLIEAEFEPVSTMGATRPPIVYATPPVEPPDEVKEPEPPTSTPITLNDLLAKWTPEQIVGANDNTMPTSEEDFARIAAKLEGEQVGSDD